MSVGPRLKIISFRYWGQYVAVAVAQTVEQGACRCGSGQGHLRKSATQH